MGKISKDNKVKIKIQGIDAIPNFIFKSKNTQYKTFITQEMLKYKILAANVIFCSLPHKDQIMNKYFDKLNDIFKKISNFENGKDRVENFMETDVCIDQETTNNHKVFMINQISYGGQFIDNKDINLVSHALKEKIISSGNLVSKFENKISKFLKAKYIVSCNSGTSAFYLSLKAAGIKK